MWKLQEDEKDTIEYIVAIAMIIFGMILCMFAFFTPPVRRNTPYNIRCARTDINICGCNIPFEY